MPGAPIMRSTDFTDWETIGYLFDKLTDSPKYDMNEGTVYGRGQWATSLKYHNGRFYALFAPNDNPGGETYIMTAAKAEGPWTIVSRLRHFHDASLFFDDDDRVYVFFGTGEMVELSKDLQSVVEGSHRKIFQREKDETGLLEGSRMVKKDGTYYLLMISWPAGGKRRQVCYRTNDLLGQWEKKVVLLSDFGGFPYVGQGTIVDGKDGQWYGVIFQDRGGVGRVLTLMPCRWVDGWPMLGDDSGKVPETMPFGGSETKHNQITHSDDFSSEKLGLHWQWNHNPIDSAWSLTDRQGFLRMKTSRTANSIYDAPNTVTQRMEGPKCSGIVCLDISKMNDGDRAGFSAFNGDSGLLTIARDGKTTMLTMTSEHVSLDNRSKAITDVKREQQGDAVKIKRKKVWLRIDGDFTPHRDIATFYYSFDGSRWTKIGNDYKMIFDYRRFFMGTKFAIFNYATKTAGGFVDVDSFEYKVIDN